MSVRDTSLSSYLNEISPTLGARQIAVMEVFERSPGKDFTNCEIARDMGAPINCITGRTNELRTMGILEESQKRKCEVTGREVHAWRVKERPAVSPKAISPVPSRYQMPSMSQPGLTHKIIDAKCDCKGFLFRGKCSHLEKLARRVPKPEETMNSLFAV